MQEYSQIADHGDVARAIDIELRDFGPLAAGHLALRPLTVIIGPSNSGKSVVATLLWVLHEAASIVPAAPRRNLHRLMARLEGEPDISPEVVAELFSKAVGGFMAPIFGSVWQMLDHQPADDWDDKSVFAAMFGDRLGEELRAAFPGKSADSIVRTGADEGSISLRGPRLECKLTIGANDAGRRLDVARVTARLSREDREWIRGLHGEGWQLPERLLRLTDLSDALGILSSPAFYLPAARSGYMRVRQVLTSGLLRAAGETPGGGSRPVGRHELDFLARFLSIDPKAPGPLAGLADDIERLLFDGRVVAVGSLTGFPMFRYETADLSLPIERVSSGVAELAPLILFVRYLVAPGDALIIEEPEAHLHPAMQRKVAIALALLVRAGVYVVITTHSGLMVEQIGHLVQRSAIRGDRRQVGLPPGEAALDPDAVAVHLTRPVEGGYELVPVPVSVEAGIDTDDLSAVHLALYEEQVALEDVLFAEDEAE